MKRALISAVSLAAALAAGHAFAAEPTPLSRDQVRAELAEAIRTGDIVVAGEAGLKANELRPLQYPAKAVTPGKTREQAEAELAQAIRTGDVYLTGEMSLKANETQPSNEPKTRAQVQAELKEAIRTGQMPKYEGA